MPQPSIAEIRAKVHPPGWLQRRSGEHWAGRLYMRKVSPYFTRWFAILGLTPNQVTWLMVLFGVLSGPALLVPGIWGAVLALICVQLYLLLDCSDGELARWTGIKSNIGVYLDRVGAYFADAALLVGLGFRAGQSFSDGYAVLGLAAALGAILIKSETDLVGNARAQVGLGVVTEEAVEPSNPSIAKARRAAAALKFYRLILNIELAFFILATAIIDAVRGDLIATQVLTVACFVVACLQVVLHLASVLVSKRLQA